MVPSPSCLLLFSALCFLFSAVSSDLAGGESLPPRIMESSSQDFPSLSHSISNPSGRKPPLDWSNILNPTSFSSKDLPVSFVNTQEEVIVFPEAKTDAAFEEWNLSLVGYSVGRRPYYEALLAAIRKAWKLQGKPFILQKWSPRFRPQKENIKMVPIWFKIPDLLLCCWNSEGISKIASKVHNKTIYPDTIPISVEDEIISLKIQYEWHPTPCNFCKSLLHTPSTCPSNPHSQPLSGAAQVTHGRSQSRVSYNTHSRGPSRNNTRTVQPMPSLPHPGNSSQAQNQNATSLPSSSNNPSGIVPTSSAILLHTDQILLDNPLNLPSC
ncbi:hypothetical protein M5K25_011579 [Dendrobium thyrsiflorum]|uniref:DUF4283 domain-containing protein n=1 Tax=Dendrobium thyrsiflorum TaxID=117978 RepID=A0ABD0V354_DENTH